MNKLYPGQQVVHIFKYTLVMENGGAESWGSWEVWEVKSYWDTFRIQIYSFKQRQTLKKNKWIFTNG